MNIINNLINTQQKPNVVRSPYVQLLETHIRRIGGYKNIEQKNEYLTHIMYDLYEMLKEGKIEGRDLNYLLGILDQINKSPTQYQSYYNYRRITPIQTDNELIKYGQQFIGMHEKHQTKRLRDLFSKSRNKPLSKICPENDPWCASYVSRIFEQNKYEIPNRYGALRANAYRNYGTEGKGNIGDVALFGDKKDIFHIGIVAGKTKDGKIKVLSGNQIDRVNISLYNPHEIYGFRTPVKQKSMTMTNLMKQTPSVRPITPPIRPINELFPRAY